MDRTGHTSLLIKERDRNNALIKSSPDVNICQVKPDSHEHFSWKNFKLYDICHEHSY